ncbi:MAG TPA: hypothetical protein VFN67_33640 [Polyangiales bacterium]|nr:hypothetical protein [Polyangiales bacterium]
MKRVPTVLMLLAAACTVRTGDVRPPSRTTAVEPLPSLPVTTEGLYSAQGALRDVLSGELEHIGTGKWPGVERLRACAFRNKRVVVVNAYCSLYEQPAFRVEVYSPQRGRVRIYAETRGVVSTRLRRDYFTFMVEGSPPPAAAARLPALSLNMGYEELRRYEQQRYDAFLPSCFGGEQHERAVGGCLGALASRQSEWVAENRVFLDQANDDWYQVVRKLRALATKYGVEPAH